MKIVSVPGVFADPAWKFETLLVRAIIDPSTPLLWYDPPMLDSLLAWAAVHRATKGRGLPHIPDDSAYATPVPLQVLSYVEELPVHVVTPFRVVSRKVRDVIVATKRTQSGRWTKSKSGRLVLTPGSGRWRSRLIPRPAFVGPIIECECAGDMDALAPLLQRITHIGKKRSAGCGLVVEWQVEPLEREWQLVRGNRLVRTTPAAAVDDAPEGVQTILAGWTPPYWRRCLWRECYQKGTVWGAS